MLISTVLEPSIFHLDFIKQDSNALEAFNLIRGVHTNGLILVEEKGGLLATIKKNLQELPTKYGQKLTILFEEILKKPKRILHVRIDNPEEKKVDKILAGLNNQYNPDAAIVCNVGEECYLNCSKKNYICLSEYTYSGTETLRYKYAQGLPPIDQIDDDEFTEAITRTVKYATWIRFYDKQIGQGGNLKGWFDTLDLILDIWKNEGCFYGNPNAFIQIITTEKHGLDKAGSDQIRTNYVKDNFVVAKKVHNNLIAPLSRKYNKVSLIVKKFDSRNIFHPRHLQTQNAIVQSDRGFDLIKEDKTRKRSIMKLDYPASLHLQECRGLPDAEWWAKLQNYSAKDWDKVNPEIV
ncbi:hypothetical protein GO013_02430 [Pseudodesulfovibrio sp. JC047]|uniref:hypothetical protein n=1 Tax=Pseudodesulfovibrio sp. JC047 TaxID=2683199 RepID=UPI0013D6F7E7|nr:hypothetical protein [Pseudodesulfovibrio sp. JC047]NDV18272.1 hypothetical protein [Pseudodesulfovibrio sp. JC047]